MKEQRPRSWHIDGWDALGGRAFATRRERGIDLSENRPSWGPTVYIGPPSFVPEIVVSVATALSAARSAQFVSFVPAGPDSPLEATFPSAETVAELVRRTFVGNGRGRGGDGGAPDVTPMPTAPDTEGGGEIRNAPAQEPDDVANYLAHFQKMQGDKYALESAGAVSLESESLQAGRFSVPASRVEAGAAHLVGVLLAQAVNDENPRWKASASTLHRALAELDYWNLWMWTKGATSTARIADYWARYLPAIRHWRWLSSAYRNISRDQTIILSVSLYLQGTILNRWVIDPELFREFKDKFLSLVSFDGNGSQNVGPFDRYEAMLDWSLPTLRSRDTCRRNAGALLSAFVSRPQDFAGDTAAGDIVCFLAALLASRTADRTQPGWQKRAAESWLRRSLPRYVFDHGVERLIIGA